MSTASRARSTRSSRPRGHTRPRKKGYPSHECAHATLEGDSGEPGGSPLHRAAPLVWHGGEDSLMSEHERSRHILVVANETVVSPALVDLIEQKAKDGAVHVTVLAPVNQPRQGYVVYYDTRRAAARRRLEKTLDLLRSAGIPADGIVVESDPVSALQDAIHQLEPDEIVVSTHPQQKSGWLRRNAVEQMRRVTGDLPFQHDA